MSTLSYSLPVTLRGNNAANLVENPYIPYSAKTQSVTKVIELLDYSDIISKTDN